MVHNIYVASGQSQEFNISLAVRIAQLYPVVYRIVASLSSTLADFQPDGS